MSIDTGGRANMSFGDDKDYSINSDEGTPKARTETKGLAVVGTAINNDF